MTLPLLSPRAKGTMDRKLTSTAFAPGIPREYTADGDALIAPNVVNVIPVTIFAR